MVAKSNPNKANQYVLDPRQKLCWDFYTDPKSETFSSGLASALKAGYERGTAEQITVADWFIEKLRTLNMLDKAERNLDKIMDMETEQMVETKDGGLLSKQDAALVGQVAKVSMFIAERVGKATYSTRTELTGANGGAIQINKEDLELANKLLENE
jgi:hypothetical protein